MRVVSINAQSADETKGAPVHAVGSLACYIEGLGTIASGVVTLEEASFEPGNLYTGTWSEITTVDAADVTGGAQLAVHFATGAYSQVRPRISTAIGGGGNVSVYFEVGGE